MQWNVEVWQICAILVIKLKNQKKIILFMKTSMFINTQIVDAFVAQSYT